MIETINAIAVVVTATVTVVYVVLTYFILRANRDQFLSISRPYICISLFSEPDSIEFCLRIHNTGKSNAEKLRLSLDRPFHCHGVPDADQDISKFSAFNEPILSFPPDSELVFHLANANRVLGGSNDPALTPPVFKVRAIYFFAGRKIDETTTLDCRPYLQAKITHDPYHKAAREIAQSIEKIPRAIEKYRH